ncbi:methyltransferase [Paenibacillus campinasensis]|uniref:Methyltransferase domain-containing protein n=1 Tax=Paenibacillus campinasensis TaxID=66347 RepID=A0A268F095_9BACL|nr:methyltransferase [Paenibacillus campinasensis]PAD78790.1 hypothetical protein CHH67_05775 [Paenibacillus campinasensis]
MALTRCSYCGYMYDEWNGDSRNGVPPGIPITKLAGTVCSRCGIQGVRHERQQSPKYEGDEAEYYDQFAGKAGVKFYKSWIKASLKPVKALELGVGTGRLATELAPLTEQYCGVDWSPRMLKAAEAKRKRIFKDTAEERWQLVEQDALKYHPETQFTHVLCPDGFLQHFTLMDEHVALLGGLHRCMEDGGWIAVDVHLPPSGIGWKMQQRKQLLPNKWISRQLEGETSLLRQVFRCMIDYETYREGTMTSKYRVEREFALMTPKETALLLSAAGFEVSRIVCNFGLTEPWLTALPPGTYGKEEALGATETIKEAMMTGKNVTPYIPDQWGYGGGPMAGAMPVEPPEAPATVTLIARKATRT